MLKALTGKALLYNALMGLVILFFSPEAVIKRFEQREHEVDSIGVAEYLRALVVTNTIADYLPDDQSGKPSALPALVVNLVPLFHF